MNLLAETFKSKGYRLTRARRSILAAVDALSAQPFSAEQVFDRVRRAKVSCDLTSVYRTLAALQEENLIKPSDVTGPAAYYERVSGHSHKHHIVCKRCHRIDPVDICQLKGFDQLLSRLGYREISHRLEFVGLCSRC